MPPVSPFAALRYSARAGELQRLICPPYDVISSEEQAQLEALSPYNAVYLELPRDDDGRPGSRYSAAARRLEHWRNERVLCPGSRAAYYVSETEYATAGETHRRRDLLGAVAVGPWSDRVVLPHEHTMPAPKADGLELLRSTHLNSSPIWLLYRDRLPALDQV